MRLTSGADTRHECDELIRQGSAALLGTGAEREHIPPDIAEALGKPQVVKDAQAASALFITAETRAREAALHDVVALALFGRGAAAAEQSDFGLAVDCFAAYFALEKTGSATNEPPLGDAYGRFHSGMALYRLQRVEESISQLEAYLLAVQHYRDVKICTVDSWGLEIFTALDKELKRQRQWVVCGRCEFTARRMLAALFEQRAATSVSTDTTSSAVAMRAAIQHFQAAGSLAWEGKQSQETQSALEEAQQALRRLEVTSGGE
jgi:hypothetical protein